MRVSYLYQIVMMMFSGYFICVQKTIFIYRGDKGLKLLLEHLGFRFQLDKMKLFYTTDIFGQAIYVGQNLSSRRIPIYQLGIASFISQRKAVVLDFFIRSNL